MSRPGSEQLEDSSSTGKQNIIPGEQSSGTVASGSGSGGGSSGGRSSSSRSGDSNDEEDLREARRIVFRNTLGTLGTQFDEQVFYDTTPDEEASSAHSALERNEAVEDDGADQERDNSEMSEGDGADHEYNHNNHNNNYTQTPAYDGWSSGEPSGSEKDRDDDNFAARLIVALQDAADVAVRSSDVEVADSQASSDEPNDNTGDAASTSDGVIPDSQANSDDLVVRSDTSDDDADTIVVRNPTRMMLGTAPGRLAAPYYIRAPTNHRIGDDPDSDPDSDSSGDDNSTSSLSDLEKTPEPVDPELVRLDREYKMRNLKLCSCLGWCSCIRYTHFYGSEATEKQGEGGEGEEVEQKEVCSRILPSQTHLSEAALANERFPISAMRSTISVEKRFEEHIVGQQTFSWDRERKPVRAPVSWAGGEWTEFPGNYRPATVEQASDDGD
jgi:hypothetical protein